MIALPDAHPFAGSATASTGAPAASALAQPPAELVNAVTRAASATSAENALLRLAIEQMPLGLSMFDAHDRLMIANRRWAEIWGLPAALAAPGTPFADIRLATKGRQTGASAKAVAAGGDGVRRQEWLMDDGRSIEVVVTRMPDGSFVAVHEDVTEQRRAEARIAYLARHDLLTGLPNRHVLIEELEFQLRRHARGETLAVLCLDLDHFKAVNDALGHASGDLLLTEVAQRLRACARETDVIARLGGDEFAILQVGAAQPSGSTLLARRVIEVLSRPYVLEGQQAYIGTSVGIALAPHDGEDPAALLKHADLALYRAKGGGRGTLRYFEPDMDAQAQARRTIETELRDAVAHGQLELAYQPLVDLRLRRVDGVEALLRWQHPQRGLMAPAEFLPIAEETGLIAPIGRWVLAQACRDALAWPEDVRVAVNVSAVQFRRGQLLQDVEHALATTGLPAARLELEITESALLTESDRVLAQLRALRERGVRVALDDFGTGCSSLSHVRNFPFDRLKVDRSFVRDLQTDPDARAIVRAIAGLGRSLGLATTVEGVETAEQLALVLDEGGLEVQGYLFSTPRPAGEVMSLLRTAVLPAPAPLQAQAQANPTTTDRRTGHA